MNALKQILQLSTLMLLLASCALPIEIRPPPAGTKITELCIIDNPKVLMDGFLPELKKQIRSHGIKTQTWSSYNPDGCRYWLDYTANWKWDLVMYMIYADLKLYDRQTLIGEATFDNTGIGPRRYGSADEKLKALTGPLFAQH